MEDQELYRIEEYTTTGWELADAEYVKLEKPNCQYILNQLCLLYTSDAADD